MNPHQKRTKKLKVANRDKDKVTGDISCYLKLPGCLAVRSWAENLSDVAVMDFAKSHRIYPPSIMNGSGIQWLRRLPELAIKALDLEHIDNLSDDAIDNLALACHACNEKKNPAPHPSNRRLFGTFEKYTCRYRREKEQAENIGLRIEFKTLKRNIEMEPRFKAAVIRILRKYPSGVPRDELIYAACQDAANKEETIMPVTGDKYLKKLASAFADSAICEEFDDGPDDMRITMVRLRKKK